MDDLNRNPFEGHNAVRLDEYLESCTAEQRKHFDEKCKSDPNFDWRVLVNGKPVEPGTPWSATWEETGSAIRPFVNVDKNGFAIFIRPSNAFGQFMEVLAMRSGSDGRLEIGVVYQKRGFAPTGEHPGCLFMASLVRGFIDKDESPEDALGREVREELCHHIVSAPIFLGLYNSDSSYVTTWFPVFAVMVGERDRSLKLDAKEQILDIHWFSLPDLLERLGTVSVEDCGTRGRQEVNFAGVIDFFALLPALTRVSDFRKAMIEALTSMQN